MVLYCVDVSSANRLPREVQVYRVHCNSSRGLCCQIIAGAFFFDSIHGTPGGPNEARS